MLHIVSRRHVGGALDRSESDDCGLLCIKWKERFCQQSYFPIPFLPDGKGGTRRCRVEGLGVGWVPRESGRWCRTRMTIRTPRTRDWSALTWFDCIWTEPSLACKVASPFGLLPTSSAVLIDLDTSPTAVRCFRIICRGALRGLLLEIVAQAVRLRTCALIMLLLTPITTSGRIGISGIHET